MRKVLHLIICLFMFCAFAKATDGKFVIVIDAGHGGKDGGAVRGSYKEKEINLAVVLAFGKMIEENHKDVRVVYTRKTDVFVDLNKRAQIANRSKANLFVSVHTNSTAAKVSSVSGADTYILGLAKSEENLNVAKRENSVILLEDDYSSKYEGFDPKSTESYIIFEFMSNKYMEQSLAFANFVQRDFSNVAKRTDRGVRQAGFLVLRKSSMPSVLIELGFINNPTEAKFLTSRSGQQAMASAIYSGFKKYKRDFDKKQGRYVALANDKDEQSKTEEAGKGDVLTDNVETPPVRVLPDSDTSKSTVRPVVSQVAAENIGDKIEYRVQFLVSPQKLPDGSPKFKGLSPADFYQDGNYYKYTSGSTTDLNEILKIQREIRTKFSDAFIVKFKNGKRI